jgi:hypothetical protein
LPTMQQRPWGLLILGCRLPELMAIAGVMGSPSLWVVGALRPPLLGTGFEEPWSLLQAWGNQVFG